MSTILIIEDDFVQRKNLVKIIQGIKKDFNILEAGTLKEALTMANDNDIDLFYIDICLSVDSGLDVASEIRKIQKYKLTWIVFVTTHVSYIVEAFKKIHCYDYIMKPYDKENIEETTLTLLDNDDRITKDKEAEKRYITFDIGDIWIKIAVDEIIFVEVFLRTCYIHTECQVYKIDYISLKKVVELINNDNFIQCHRSFVVNLEYVKRLQKNGQRWDVVFKNYDKVITVGKNYEKELKKYFL